MVDHVTALGWKPSVRYQSAFSGWLPFGFPTSKATLIDISSAGGYGPSMTITLFAAALYYAPLS